MSTAFKLTAAVLLVAGIAACSKPAPEPAPVVEAEPVFTGKV